VDTLIGFDTRLEACGVAKLRTLLDRDIVVYIVETRESGRWYALRDAELEDSGLKYWTMGAYEKGAQC
tara:strand:+ start:759 stop:962 length:204 start_codon:yes stop_codon:yes gene_type:complete